MKLIVSRKYNIVYISSALRSWWKFLWENKSLVMFGQGCAFFVRCFISAESLFSVPCNSNLLRACSGLSLLVADPSYYLWKILHVYIWNCSKVSVSTESLLMVCSAPKCFPKCLQPGTYSSFEEIVFCFQGSHSSFYLFSQWRRERFYPSCYEAWRFSWVKTSSLLGKSISVPYV